MTKGAHLTDEQWALAVSTATRGLDLDAIGESIIELQRTCIREAVAGREIDMEAVTACVRDVMALGATTDDTIARMLATLAHVSVQEGRKGGAIDNKMLHRHTLEIVTLMLSDRDV
jgi:hypothetical protein